MTNLIYDLNHCRYEGVKLKKVVFSLLILPFLLSGLFVFAQEQQNFSYQVNCNVTSTTALWNPGIHNFTMTWQGQLFTPIDTTFSLNGSGTINYSMVGGGSPPGELDLTINLSGYLNDTFFNGLFNLTAVAHATTMLVTPTAGFIRTEVIQNLTAYLGTFNEYTWDIVNHTATVDFSSFDPSGTAFQIRITGSGPGSYILEFSSIVIIPLSIIATMVAVTIARKSIKKQNSQKTSPLVTLSAKLPLFLSFYRMPIGFQYQH